MNTPTKALGAIIVASLMTTACGQSSETDSFARTTSARNPSSSDASVDLEKYRYDPEKDCYKADAFVCDVEAAIHQLTNEHRVKSGVQPVGFSMHLTYSARVWSDSQAQDDVISHDGFPNAREITIVDEFGAGAPVKVLAENVAQNHLKTDAMTTATAIIRQWWESPGHKANMLGDYPHLGVGVAFQGTKIFATQIFGRDDVPPPPVEIDLPAPTEPEEEI